MFACRQAESRARSFPAPSARAPPPVRLPPAASESLLVRHPMPGELASELEVLFPARRVLGDRKVVDFEAQAGIAVRIRVLDAHQAPPPAARQHRRVRRNALRVVAVLLVEPRSL